MGLIKNIINAITGKKSDKKKEKKTETQKTTSPKITTAGPVKTTKTIAETVQQTKTDKQTKTTSTKAPAMITAADIATPVKKSKTTKKTTSTKAPAMITAADIVTPLKRAKQEKKLSEGKGPVKSFNANETFIERAKKQGAALNANKTFIERAMKQGTAKEKERAERIERVLNTNKARSDIKELNKALDVLDELGIFDSEPQKKDGPVKKSLFDQLTENKKQDPYDALIDYTNIDKQFRKTDAQKRQEAINKLLDLDFDKIGNTYAQIEKGIAADTFLNSEADFLKEVKILSSITDKEVGERDRKIVEERVNEKTAKGIKTNFRKEWAEYQREVGLYEQNTPGKTFLREETITLSGDRAKPVYYMSEDQIEEYYYLLATYGKDEALKYFETLKPQIIKNAQNYTATEEYKKIGENHPILSNATKLPYVFKGIEEGFETVATTSALGVTQKLLGDTRTLEDVTRFENTLGGTALNSIREGAQSTTDSQFAKVLLGLLHNVSESPMEIAFQGVPVLNVVGELTGGAINASTKRSELYVNNTLDKKGSGASITNSFILGVLPIGLIGSGIGKGVAKALTRGATRSGLNTFLANLAGNAVGGAVTGVTFFGLAEGADRFFMGENSPYEISVRNYMQEGMSEEAARDKATQDTFNNMITSALVGSLQSAITGLGSSRKWGVDFKKSGEKILKDEGIDGINRIINETDGMSKQSEAWRNAQRLRRRQLQGKEIYSDMLGAQDYLNSIERKRQQAFSAGITNITGIRIQRGTVDDAVNATHNKGVITLSVNPDTDLVEVIKHDTVHAAEDANPNTFAVYKNQLRNAPGYTDAIERMRKTREDAGLSTDKATLESEVAAEFARNFVKRVKDLDRLQRIVNGNPALADRIYTGLRDLSAKMKAKGGMLFVDEATGIKIRYDELNTLTNLYEGMLLNTRESFFSSSSPMHHVKQNNDARNFGVAIHTELASISNKRMSAMWKNNRDEVKELIRDAYRSYKKGDTETGDKILDRAGAIWAASLKKGGTADAIEEFTAHFKTQYNEGEFLNRQIERNKQTALDLENHNMNIGAYVKGLMSDIGVAKGRTNPDEEAVIREAFDNIKNNNEEGARAVLYPFAEDLFKRTKKGLEDRDNEVLSFIRSSRMKLDRNGEGGEDIKRLQKVSRGTYDETSNARTPDSVLKEMKELFPEYPWTKDTDTHEAPVTEIMRIYDLIKDSADRPKYNPQDVPQMAKALTDDIISSYRNNVPASKETDKAVRMSDEANYGIDIEGGIRDLDIEGLKERDVKECAENIRRSIDDITLAMDEGIKSGIIDSAVTKYDELTKGMMDTISKELMKRGYTADDATDIAMYMFRAIYETTENRVNRYIKEADDTVAALYGKELNPETDDIDAPPEQPIFDIYRDDKNNAADRAKSRKVSATEAKKKISSLFENTAKKDFFEGAETELNSRIDEFMYEAVRNRDTAKEAIEYVKEKGERTVYRELATMTGGVTAFDTAKAWALAVEYRKRINNPATSPEARTRYSRLMVDVLAIMREKWTEAGQATQSIKLFNLLTLEGQLMEFKRRADAGVENQLRKRPDYEKIKAEEQVAKRKDRARKAREASETEEFDIDETEVPTRKPRKRKTQETDTDEAEETDIDETPAPPRKPRKRKPQETETEETEETDLDESEEKPRKPRKPRKKKEKTPQSELEKLYDKYGIKYISEELFQYAQDTLKAIDDAANANSLDDVIDIIMQNSRKRNTNTSKRLPGKLRRYYKSETKLASGDSTKAFEVLTNTARQQVFSMIDDALPKSTGSKSNGLRRMGLLDNPTTFLRNVISNFALTPMETITNDLAILPDLVMYIFTHRRTVGLELPGGYINAARRMRKAALEQNLKVNTFIDSEGGYSGSPASRTYVGKTMSKLEELTGYNLTVSDETQKGIIEARVERSLKRLVEKGHLTPDEVAEIVANEMKYRTFQDDTILGKILDDLQKAANFGRDFGIGDLVITFTKVPGAVITRNLEYSPAGYAKFIWTVCKTAFNAKKQKRGMTAQEQRELALTLARPTTSLGIIATGALLASKGIIVGSDIDDKDDDNYLLKKFRKVTGANGYKLNWDGLCRYLDGKDSEIQNGDRLFDISWAPFAPQLLVGANMQREQGYDFDGLGDSFHDWWASVGYMLNPLNAPKVVPDTLDYTLEQMSDLPALQGIRDVMESWEYKEGYVDFALQLGSNWALSFEPQILKKLGNVLDPNVRDPYHGETPWIRAWQNIEANLPIPPLRKNVPEQINVFGEPVSGTLGSWWKDILNEMLSPGRVSVFEESGLMEELDILYQYNDDALLKTPRMTGNTAMVEDKTVKFNLYGEDYEEYSKWLGSTTVRNITEFMNSDYYKYLPYYQRAAAVAEINKKSEEACRTAWAEKLCEADTAKQNEILDRNIESYQQMAEVYVRANQAKDYIQKDKINVENVVNCYIERPYTEAEKAEYIREKKRGKYTENERKIVEKLQAGLLKKHHYIEGKWSELTEEEQQKVLQYIESYPDNVVVPEGLMLPENLTDFSDAEPPEDDAVIDITDGYSRKKLLDDEETQANKTTSKDTPTSSVSVSTAKTSGTKSSGAKSSGKKSSGGKSRGRKSSGSKSYGRTVGYYSGIETANAMTGLTDGIGYPGNTPLSFTGEEQTFKHPFKRPFKFKVPFKDNKPSFIYPFDKV